MAIIKLAEVACKIDRKRGHGLSGEELAVRAARYEPYRGREPEWRVTAEVIAARYCLLRAGLRCRPDWRGTGMVLPDDFRGLRWSARWVLGPHGWYIQGIEWGRARRSSDGSTHLAPEVYHEIPNADPGPYQSYTRAELPMLTAA